MAASSGSKSLSDEQNSVSDHVAKSAAEAVERLQRAAHAIAADANRLSADESKSAIKSRSARLTAFLAPKLAVARGNWGKALAASITCSAIAIAAILGLRDGARPENARTTTLGFSLPWKSGAEDAQKTQDLRNQIQALAQEVHGLRAQAQKQAESAHKQAEDIRATQARVSATATSVANAGNQANARLDRIERESVARLERAERETAVKLEQHVARIERMERLVADPVVTSSIPKSSTNPPAALKAPPQPGKPDAYVLRSVRNGVATVQTRRGLIEVAPGDTIPGVGRVRSIEKVDGRWVVMTRNGIIDAE